METCIVCARLHVCSAAVFVLP